MIGEVERSLVLACAVLIGCSNEPKAPSDAASDVVMEAAAADAPSDAGTCPSVHCPNGQYCLVNGGMPDASLVGTCQPIPATCMSNNICMCPIIVCSGPGNIQGCSNDTIYCN